MAWPGVTQQVVKKQGVLVALLVLAVHVDVAWEHQHVVAHLESAVKAISG